MKNKYIYDEWSKFINNKKYNIYIITNKKNNYSKSDNNKWNIKLIKVKEYIDKYKKRPLRTDKDDDIKFLAKWCSDQRYNYKKK